MFYVIRVRAPCGGGVAYLHRDPASRRGLDTKTYWLTDRQSQCNFDFDFEVSIKLEGWVVAGVLVESRGSRVIEQEMARRLNSDLKC
jgi:hypothetical protein